ncbi:MAG: response regulator transcription factor [Burkholderiales bacterium]|nr:response regulator transcription factor [Burkholderiales bacterium]
MNLPPTALIAEDEPLLAAGLRAELAQLWPELQIVALAGDGLTAVTQALALRPRLCFFDIRMPGCSGLEAAAALAEDWPDGAEPFPLLVFVTAYDAYALQAFEAQAVDYLVKPVQTARLATCVTRLRARLAASGDTNAPSDAETLQTAMAQLRGLLAAAGSSAAGGGGASGAAGVAGAGSAGPMAGHVAGMASSAGAAPRLAVIQAQVGATIHLVPVQDVVYFEAADKYVRVITAEREYLIRTALRELLPQLDSAEFWQIHRGTVVQARCIELARRDEAGKVSLTLRGRPEKLPVSRLYAQLFKGM